MLSKIPVSEKLFWTRVGWGSLLQRLVRARRLHLHPKVEKNNGHEAEIETPVGPHTAQRATATMAREARYAGEAGCGAPESFAGASESINGLRWPAYQRRAPANSHDWKRRLEELKKGARSDAASALSCSRRCCINSASLTSRPRRLVLVFVSSILMPCVPPIREVSSR